MVNVGFRNPWCQWRSLFRIWSKGHNTFQGTNAGQTCWSFNWGQHGQNGIIVRIYYGPSKPHSTGSITSPSSSGTIGENPTITASTSGNVNRVDFLASYTGWDTDADGIFTGYHSDYHREKTETSVGIKNHVGTDMTSPFSVVWNTDMVPDQAAGSVKVLARIRDASGVWFVTNEVTGLTLHRTNASVKMYHTYDMPQRFTVRVTRQTTTVHFNIPSSDDLSKAVSAKLIMHTFNGIDGDHAAGETHYTKVNSWAAPLYGVDHFYSYDVLTMPPSALKSGTNAVACNSNSTSTGWYCLWPGPGIIVRYSGSAPPPGPATKLAFGTAAFCHRNRCIHYACGNRPHPGCQRRPDDDGYTKCHHCNRDKPCGRHTRRDEDGCSRGWRGDVQHVVHQ